MPMSRSPRHEPDSLAISSFTIVAVRIRVLQDRHPIRCIFNNSRSPERPNSTRSDPLIDSHHVVQKTGHLSPYTPQQNGLIERFFRSLKEECVWQHWFGRFEEARQKINAWMRWYNEERPHQALQYRSPRQYR